MPNPDEIRASQRAMWGKFSAGWEKWDEVVVASIASVGEAMIRALTIADDQQHLEVAAGTGEPGLTIAALAPHGKVTLTDLAPEMLAVAGRRAKARGLTNVAFEECGAEELPFADATFDSIGCRFGFMFIPDMAKALSEIRPRPEAGRTRVHRCVGEVLSTTRGRLCRWWPSWARCRCHRPIPTGRACFDVQNRGR